MIVGDRLRELREAKHLSQSDIEKQTGLLRCYISRVENGHTVPSVETLEKFARALGVPMYRLFYEGPIPAALPQFTDRRPIPTKDSREIEKFRKLFSRMSPRDQQVLIRTAASLARGKGKKGIAA